MLFWSILKKLNLSVIDFIQRANQEVKVKFVQVSVAEDHTCSLTNIGTIECFGENDRGTAGS